jgi:RNase P subunit RPR2
MFKRFIKNLKVLKTILIGTVIYCPRCRSLEVKHGVPEVEIDGNMRDEYYIVKCSKCGYHGIIHEYWQDDEF